MTDKTLETIDSQINDLPKISESEFRKFVPILTDPKADPEERKKWINISMDPRNSVLVVDDKTGEVLHRVPPLVYTSDQITGRDIAGTLMMLEKMNEVSALHGKNYAERNIDRSWILGKPPEEDIKLWQEILERYGLKNQSTTGNESIEGSLQDDPDDW
jgi:hypothetical protein